MFTGVANGLALVITKISLLPGVASTHVTLILLPIAAICGKKEPLAVLLKFIGVPKLVSLSLLTEKKISKSLGVSSSHVT